MTVIAVALAASILLIVAAFLRHIAQCEAAWTAERRELLTRIQRPELLPSPSGAPFVSPDPEPDEIELVGTIQEPKE